MQGQQESENNSIIIEEVNPTETNSSATPTLHIDESYKKCLFCDKCQKSYDSITEADNCLRSHNFLRCFGCFETMKNNKVVLSLHHLDRHYELNRPTMVNCPFCLQPQSQSMNALKNHVIQEHFDKKVQQDSISLKNSKHSDAPNEEILQVVSDHSDHSPLVDKDNGNDVIRIRSDSSDIDTNGKIKLKDTSNSKNFESNCELNIKNQIEDPGNNSDLGGESREVRIDRCKRIKDEFKVYDQKLLSETAVVKLQDLKYYLPYEILFTRVNLSDEFVHDNLRLLELERIALLKDFNLKIHDSSMPVLELGRTPNTQICRLSEKSPSPPPPQLEYYGPLTTEEHVSEEIIEEDNLGSESNHVQIDLTKFLETNNNMRDENGLLNGTLPNISEQDPMLIDASLLQNENDGVIEKTDAVEGDIYAQINRMYGIQAKSISKYQPETLTVNLGTQLTNPGLSFSKETLTAYFNKWPSTREITPSYALPPKKRLINYQTFESTTSTVPVHTTPTPVTIAAAPSQVKPTPMTTNTRIVPLPCFNCKTCWKIYTTEKRLKRHLGSHDDSRKFFCYRCRKSFTKSKKLKKHQEKFHKTMQKSTGVQTNFNVVSSLLKTEKE